MTDNCIINAYKNDGCSSCSQNCAYKIAMDARQNYAQIPADYRDKTLASNPLGEKEQARLERYVATFTRRFDDSGAQIKSLYLYSAGTGTGKTTSAAVAINEWIARGYISELKRGINPETKPAFFLEINDFQMLYNKFNRANIPREVAEPAAAEYYAKMEKAKVAPLAVLDDIGVRSASEPFRADLHEIINHRITNKMPTIYTSNVQISQLNEIYDKRLTDRVRDMCAEFTYAGESHRGHR